MFDQISGYYDPAKLTPKINCHGNKDEAEERQLYLATYRLLATLGRTGLTE